MKIVLFGATGMVGSRIAAEAVRRGHEVTAVSRSGGTPVPGTVAAAADATDAAKVAELAVGHDVIASALAPPRDGTDPEGPFLAANQALADGASISGTERLVVVGGAGSLEIAPGQALVDQPEFPEAFRGEALAHRDVLAFYRELDDPDLDWTYISPAPDIAPGERTGHYRLGGDALLAQDDGTSRISAEDYAVAFVDEVENHTGLRSRLSVAY